MSTDDEPAEDEAAVLSAVGASIADARSRSRYSQQGLATEAGINRSFLSGIENGTRNPTVMTVVRLARALDTTVADLLRGIS